MKITKEYFGITPDGQEAQVFTLTNSNNMIAKITNYGGILLSLIVPDINGKLRDVVLGYDTIEKYFNNGTYFGAIIGRFANRIKDGKFSIEGVEYNLALNDNGINHLHGGNKGFNAVLWDAEIIENGLQLKYLSQDGEEGYPGNLKVKVTYSLSDDNELTIDYYGVSDKTTIINLTNHSYFNLEGHNSGNVLKQVAWINALYFTPADKNSIPTGELICVKETPMDFRLPISIGERIDTDYEQLNWAKGYDQNWKLDKTQRGIERIASLYSSESGIFMEVSTTLPGIQIYSGNYVGDYIDRLGKENAKYDNRSGICFETQYFPNSINIPEFESCVFNTNEEYHHITKFKFSTK